MRQRVYERHIRLVAALLFLVLTGLLFSPLFLSGQNREDAPSPFSITHGVASGDVTATSVIVCARANAPAMLLVGYWLDRHFAQPHTGPSGHAAATHFTATTKLDDLVAETIYHYRVWFSNQTGQSEVRFPYARGSLRTALSTKTRWAVSFFFGGDLGGQQYRRPPEHGYQNFDRIQQLTPSLFIANGDMIYVDNDCLAPVLSTPKWQGWQHVPGDFPCITARLVDRTDFTQLLTVFLQHWSYRPADPGFQCFLRRIPIYLQWDDDEVVNNFGASWSSRKNGENQRQGYSNAVRAGCETMFLYAPADQHRAEPRRIYRSFRWGKELEILLLDARSYRNRNDLPDTPQHSITLPVADQLKWLKRGSVESTATWKIVSTDVPLATPTSSNFAALGRDGCANCPEPSGSALEESFAESSATDIAYHIAFERELFDLLSTLDAVSVRDLVFATTDAPFVAYLWYAVGADGDADMWSFHEFVTGPLSAISVPVKTQAELDPRLLYAEGELKNFGLARIEEQVEGKVHHIADVQGGGWLGPIRVGG